MYYYYDHNRILQGPFSESAYLRWYEDGDMPRGTEIYNSDHEACLIEDLYSRSFKSRTKVMFCEESFSLDRSCDRTKLDVTLPPTNSDSNEISISSDDFTQIEEGVDEVDCGKGSEKDAISTHLQRMVNIYFDRRSLGDQRHEKDDRFVPFEYAWSRRFPFILRLSDVIRGAVHIRNQFQCYDEDDFSIYLETLNIVPRQCYLCRKTFPNSYRMLEHFLNVIHINRTYEAESYMSMIDINSLIKIMDDFEIADEKRYGRWMKTNRTHENRNERFFETVDITTAFESMKNTIALLGTVPLLQPPSIGDSEDICGYIEFILLLREFESAYDDISENIRNRRFGATCKTYCAYCDIEFDATSLDSFSKHLLSEKHIQSAIRSLVSRKDMKFWLAFIQRLKFPNHNQFKLRKNDISLQEGDFPLCYNLVNLVSGDFAYSGEDVRQVLVFAREQVRTSKLLHKDVEYYTSCRWCHLELFSRNSVIRHILYDKCHTDRLQVVSNDDLRRFFGLLEIQITIPLFRMPIGAASKSPKIGSTAKEQCIQRLQNICYRVHKQRSMPQIAAHSFPFGLVNRCDLCQENIDRVDSLLAHFCSLKHTEILMKNFRMTTLDFEYWLEMFNVRSHSPQTFYF